MAEKNEAARREIQRAIKRIEKKITWERDVLRGFSEQATVSKKRIVDLNKEVDELSATLQTLGGPLIPSPPAPKKTGATKSKPEADADSFTTTKED